MSTSFPSAHNIGDPVEIGPTSNGTGPPMAWSGIVTGVHFAAGKVRYDVADEHGFDWYAVDSCVVRVPGVPNPSVRTDALTQYLDAQDDPPNVTRLPVRP